jgi:AcrR family transcriptional regulator
VTAASPQPSPGAGPVNRPGAPGATRRARPARRSGRRGGDSGTREAILAAARARFGDLGYDRTTIRAIAADAGVDAALVHHFYGRKDRLFVAAMRLPLNPRDLVEAALAAGTDAAGEGRGEHMIRTVLGAWDIAEMRATFFGLLRSATTSPQAAAMLREFATDFGPDRRGSGARWRR